MNRIASNGTGREIHVRRSAGSASSVPPEPGSALAKVDSLQKLLWGALIVSFPFTAVSLWPERMKTFGQPTILLAFALTALTLLGVMLPGGSFSTPRSRSAVLLLVFLVVVGGSFFLNYPINPYMWPGHSPWAKSAKQLAQWYVDGVIVYLTVRFVRTWSDFRFALQCFFISLLCTVGAGMLNVVAARWPAGYAAAFFGILHNGAWSGTTRRLTLLGYEPSIAGDYFLTALPLLVCGAYYWKSRRWAVVWSAVALVLFCGTLSMGCFGALFAAALLVGIVYARRGAKSLIVATTLLLCVIIAAAVSSSKGERFIGDRVSEILQNALDPSDIPDYSTRGRLAAAEAAFNIFLEHPITGVGVGKSPFFLYGAYPFWAYNQGDIAGAAFYYLPEGSSNYTPDGAVSFNLLLQVLAETGLVGGILFAALLLSMLADCYGAMTAAMEPWKRAAFAGILFALVAQIIHYNAMMWLGMRYWFFIWGLAICAPQLLKQKDPKMPGRRASAATPVPPPRSVHRAVTVP
jgi:O-antigen ligase